MPGTRAPEQLGRNRRGGDCERIALGLTDAELAFDARSREAFRQGLAISLDSIWIRRELAFTYLLSKDPGLARSACERQQGWVRLTGLALAHHEPGTWRGSTKGALDSLTALSDPPAYQVAQVYARWGDREHAYDWLERMYASRDGGMR